MNEFFYKLFLTPVKWSTKSALGVFLPKIIAFLTNIIILYLALKIIKKEKADFFKVLGVGITLKIIEWIWFLITSYSIYSIIIYYFLCFIIIMHNFELSVKETLLLLVIYFVLNFILGFIIFTILLAFAKCLIKHI